MQNVQQINECEKGWHGMAKDSTAELSEKKVSFKEDLTLDRRKRLLIRRCTKGA